MIKCTLKVLITSIYFVLIFCINLISQSNDTMKIETKNIIIEEKKANYDERNEELSKFTFEEHFIKDFQSNNVSEVIKHSTGISIIDYGGIGNLKTISIRGMSSNQNTITLNGIILNNNSNSMFDLSKLPSKFISNIEIVKGGASTLTNNNSLAGSINFFINPSDTLKSLYAEIGSFNSYKMDLLLPFSINIFDSKINFKFLSEFLSSANNYTFETNQFGIIENKKRENANANLLNVIFNANLINNHIEHNLLLMANSSKKGIPGPVLQGRIENSSANLKEFSFLSSYKNLFKSDFLRLENQISFKLENSNYDDLNSIDFANNGFNIKNDSKDLNFYSNLKIQDDLSSIYNFTLAYNYSNLQANNFEFDKVILHEKQLISLAASYEYFKISENNIDYSLMIAPKLSKTESFLDLTNTFSFSYNINSFKSSIKYILSRDVRYPNFNELYYYNYGNVNLKPEKSLSNTIEFKYNHSNFFDFTFAAFYSIINDKILSIPRNSISWQATNISEVKSQGLEFATNIKIIEEFNISSTYTVQSIKDNDPKSLTFNKNLPYIPSSFLSIIAIFKLDNFIISSDFSYSSSRFTSYDNNNSQLLKSYFLVNLNFEIKNLILNNSSIVLKLKNINNNNFEYISNYPMPGTSVFLGTELKF